MAHFFSVIVVGDDYEKLMNKYDANIEVEPYVRHKFKDKEKTQKQIIKVYEDVLGSKLNYSKEYIEEARRSLNSIRAMSPMDFYLNFTDGLFYDEKTGDALSTENPDGKWSIYTNKNTNFIVPFLVRPPEGEEYALESFQAMKGDIMWNLIHRETESVRIYERSWELMVEKVEPIDGSDEDLKILQNMTGRDLYFAEFDSKEEYVNYCTSFKASVFLDESGWYDINDSPDENHSWGINYYDRFLRDLPDDTLLTIFECTLY